MAFVDRQQGGDGTCALRALNNVVGRSVFGIPEVVNVRHRPNWWGDAEIEAVLTAHAEFDLIDHTRAQYEDDAEFASVTRIYSDWPTFLGFVVNLNASHWVAVRRMPNGQFESVDSIGGVRLPVLDLSEWLSAERVGSIHAVFAAIPDQHHTLVSARRERRRAKTKLRGSVHLRRVVT